LLAFFLLLLYTGQCRSRHILLFCWVVEWVSG